MFGRGRALARPNQCIGEVSLNSGSERFQFPKRFWQQPGESQTTRQPFGTGNLVKTHDSTEDTQEPRKRENEAQHNRSHYGTSGSAQNTGVFDVSPSSFKHRSVLHSRGADGFTRQTAETKIEFFAKRACHLDLSIRDA